MELAFVGLALAALSAVFGVYVFIRNEIVYRYRGECLDRIYQSPHWRAHRERFHRVGYDEMVFKFWRPVRSFYRGEPFA